MKRRRRRLPEKPAPGVTRAEAFAIFYPGESRRYTFCRLCQRLHERRVRHVIVEQLDERGRGAISW